MLKNDGPQSPAGIPVLQVKTSVAQKWGIDLAQFQKDVDADLKPRSRVLPMTIDGRVEGIEREYREALGLGGRVELERGAEDYRERALAAAEEGGKVDAVPRRTGLRRRRPVAGSGSAA